MLVAYILSNSRFLKMKLIRNKDGDVFTKDGREYKIDSGKIYQKKAFFIRLFFWCMYIEGNPNPIEFRDNTYNLRSADVSLDECGGILRRIRLTKIEKVLILVVLVNCLMVLMVLLRLYE